MSNLAEILAQIKLKAQDTLNKEIAEEIKDTEHQKTFENVYSVYIPHKYNRTGELDSIENMHTHQYGEVGIEISNDTEHPNYLSGGNTYVADVVESGTGYEYGFEYNRVARPFQKNTIDELMESGEINKLLIEGLKKRGIK